VVSLLAQASAPTSERPDNTGTDARTVYVRASDPEVLLLSGGLLEEVRGELDRLGAPDSPAPDAAMPELAGESWDPMVDAVAAWAEEQTRVHLALLERVDDDASREVLVRRAALGCAPLGMVIGAWLQWLSAPGNADDGVVMRILSLYAADLGVGHPRASRGSAYLALLRHLHLSEHAVPASRLAFDPRIADSAFYLPSLLLAMSRRPDDFRPEILGADLCLRAAGLAPALAVVRALSPHAVDWEALDPAGERDVSDVDGSAGRRERSAVTASRDALAALVEQEGAAAADRARLGFRWARAALARYTGELYRDLDAARDPRHEMAELLRRRAREGSVYHQGFELGDRALTQWLRQARTDPDGLLDALATSRLVKPGRSGASPLVTNLVSERGPMFRVFAPEDLSVIRRWIDALPARSGSAPVPSTSDHVASGPDARVEAPLAYRLTALDRAPAPDRAPVTLREAYHLLQRRTDTPSLRRFAEDYVRGWLARARYDMRSAENQLPPSWGPEGLRPWLLEQHDRHAAEFASSEGLPAKEALIDSTVQLAPLTLIDGSWLQGFTDYEHASSELGHFLFEIYWDELGNGELRLNHPLIYREVLAEMGVNLPPTASEEFARSPLLRDGSFELPVYWLCIGRFPRTFLPELLGLNLAMELSGVGGSYRRARIALKTYGFSTRFVDIHNTIDNVATGHSAWAADAVDTYLAGLPAAPGSGAHEAIWRRIRTGYRSLNPPSGYWARRAQRRAQRAGRDH
jgi:hypothetical protein